MTLLACHVVVGGSVGRRTSPAAASPAERSRPWCGSRADGYATRTQALIARKKRHLMEFAHNPVSHAGGLTALPPLRWRAGRSPVAVAPGRQPSCAQEVILADFEVTFQCVSRENTNGAAVVRWVLCETRVGSASVAFQGWRRNSGSCSPGLPSGGRTWRLRPEGDDAEMPVICKQDPYSPEDEPFSTLFCLLGLGAPRPHRGLPPSPSQPASRQQSAARPVSLAAASVGPPARGRLPRLPRRPNG